MIRIRSALKSLHHAHKHAHKHVIVAHGMELLGGVLSILKYELLAQGFIITGVATLLVAAFLAVEE